MATFPVRLPLTGASFPLNANTVGNTVIRPDQDIALAGQQPETVDLVQQPTIIYAENVIATTTGYASTQIKRDTSKMPEDFSTLIVPPSYVLPKFSSIYQLRDNYDNRIFYLDDPTRNWTFQFGDTTWQQNLLGANGTDDISVANLKESTYVFIPGKGLFKYSTDTKIFEIQTVKGIELGNIRGIVAASSFLIMHDDSRVYRSSSIDPLDFVPDLATGAGSSKVLELQSNILFALPISDGFILYTNKTCVAALYSGDLSEPFIYRPVKNCGGVMRRAHVTNDSTAGVHIAWTSNGLMQITKESAGYFNTEVTEFLNRRTYHYTTVELNTYSIKQIKSTQPLDIKVNFIGARYLAISYSEHSDPQFAQALIYDTAMKRWSKLVYPHIDLFEYVLPNQYQIGRCDEYPIPCNDSSIAGRTCASFTSNAPSFTDNATQIGILGNKGALLEVSAFDPTDLDNLDVTTSPLSVLIMGHTKLTRGRHISTNYLSLSGVASTLVTQGTFGKNFTNGAAIELDQSPAGVFLFTEQEPRTWRQNDLNYLTFTASNKMFEDTSLPGKYFSDLAGHYQDYIVVGWFDLVDLEGEIKQEGRR